MTVPTSAPPSTRSLNVTCPCSIFGNVVPKTPAANDAADYELGLRFTPTADGFVNGVRFYKGTGNTGTHVGSLWSTSGQKLASVTFSNESATGWQSATFSTPVAVTAGTTYIVSYSAPAGHYAVQADALRAGPIEADPFEVAGGFGAAPAGVYAGAGRFPDNSSRNAAHYFVDALFTTTDASPLIAMNQWPLPDSSSVPTTTTVSARYSKPLQTGTQGLTLKDPNGTAVAGSTAYDASTRTITFTPSAPLNGFVKYTATLSGTDAQGNDITTGKTWQFTTAKPPNAPGVCPCTFFDDSLQPTLLEANDPGPVTLGVRFTSDTNGTVTGVRFYKGPNNTGTHTGTLWSSTGAVLATGTFTNESSSGWQTLTFTQPVSITKNTQYIAGYRAPVGKWSAILDTFTGPDLNRAPLHVAAGAGAYTYGTGWPDNNSATNYMVDVMFEKGPPTISVTSQDPAPGAVGVARGTPIKVGFSNPITSSGYSMQVTAGGSPVAGTTQLSTDASQLTFTPAAMLPADADIKVVLSGVTSTEGAALATQSWTFHTKSPDDPNQQTLFGDVVPNVSAAPNDGSPVELGTVFKPSKDGTVGAIRFFKGTGNNGTHTGSLWSTPAPVSPQ